MINNDFIKAARKMGLFDDQDGIIKRYINEEGTWNNHLLKTKTFIENAAGNKKKDKVAVLGSGWLLDVPIEFLCSAFTEVHLADIRHPREVTHKIKNYKNVFVHIIDLSGGALIQTYNFCREYKKKQTFRLNNLKLNPLFFYHGFDFVISLNLLNQLDILIADYIKKKVKITDKELREMRELIQTNHIASLPKGRSCLITDTVEFQTNDDNNIVSEKNLIFTSALTQKYAETWIWNFDSQKAYHPDYKTSFKVIATEI